LFFKEQPAIPERAKNRAGKKTKAAQKISNFL